jgi:hypothetical protein
MTRARCITSRARTEFGSMYCHIDLDADGRPVGGSISTPQKEPEAQITRLVHTLSAALDDALKVGELEGIDA